ncbi:FadR/GntR family transcriptional regulator [Lysinimonas soli]|uniref:FadR/GntR family transcriptional regulator n=1 Tax=Lysinimonas soli TaxID=1074233 RepID=A0ABW0NKR7_9MICO
MADQIILALKRLIADGTLPRGGRLPTERELAAQYGVSAPTIREAIRALSSMGLIEVRHGSGAYVAESSRGILDSSFSVLVQWEQIGVHDLMGLLRVLHLYVADLAVNVATEDEVDALVIRGEETRTRIGNRALATSASTFLQAYVQCAHQPLLDAMCGFLTGVLIDHELKYEAEETEAYWRQFAHDTAELRLAVAYALKARDLPRLRAAVEAFHDGINARLSSLPSILDAREAR